MLTVALTFLIFWAPNKKGKEIAEDRLSGPNAKYRQTTKTINAFFHKRLQAEK